MDRGWRMSTMQKGRTAAVAITALVILGAAALVGLAGCGGEAETTSATRAAGTATTAAPMVTTTAGGVYEGDHGEAASPSSGVDQAMAGTLTALEATSTQKIISDARLELEVEKGKFQTVLDQAILLADRYGGYLVSSTSYAGGEDDSMRSGTVAVRIPSSSFNRALSDASKLGTLKNQSLTSQDVTEEYVDLEARIKNAEANVQSLVALLQKAQTVDEILYVRSVLISAQDSLESLKGRMRYLEEHTSYSTISLTIYETGVEVASAEAWGFVDALKDGLRNLVKAFNAIVRGLGILVPVLIVLGIIAYIVYRIVRAISRRNRERERARYQPYPEGMWHPQGMGHPEGMGQQPAPMGVAQPGAGQPGMTQQAAAQVPAPAPGAQPGEAAATDTSEKGKEA